MIRILIASEIQLYRERLSFHLAQHDQLDVIGSSSTCEATCRLARALRPDVVLVDIAMPDSLPVVQQMRDAAPAARVLALTIPAIDDALIACTRAGVSGFVMRNAPLRDLVDSIVGAARGETIVSPRMALALLRRAGALETDRAERPGTVKLTARERQIVVLISDGQSNKAIAAHLHVELSTVKNHVHNIFEKLRVHRRGEIASRLHQTLRATGDSARTPSSASRI